MFKSEYSEGKSGSGILKNEDTQAVNTDNSLQMRKQESRVLQMSSIPDSSIAIQLVPGDWKKAQATVDVVIGKDKNDITRQTLNGNGRSLRGQTAAGGVNDRPVANATIVNKLQEVGEKTNAKKKLGAATINTGSYYSGGRNELGNCAEPHALYDAVQGINASQFYVENATITNANEYDHVAGADRAHNPVTDARCDTCKSFTQGAGNIDHWPMKSPKK